MTGKSSRYFLLALTTLICLSVASLGLAQTKPATKRSVKRQKQEAPPTPTPAQPPAPLTPAQLPAVAPHVSYQNGQLTILAQNSTLGDILRAVSQQTGVEIDVPNNATERVVGRMGPGPARDVLASLLNGSHFDYVMTGSLQNPAAIERLLLMPKAVTNEAVTEANAAQPGVPQPQGQAQVLPQQEVVQEQPVTEEQTADDFNDQELPADQPAQDEGQQEQQQADQQPGTFNGQPAIKTPQQLLEELQQRQAQQQQQQQQGAPQGVPPQSAPQGFPIPPGAQPPQQPQQQPPQ